MGAHQVLSETNIPWAHELLKAIALSPHLHCGQPQKPLLPLFSVQVLDLVTLVALLWRKSAQSFPPPVIFPSVLLLMIVKSSCNLCYLPVRVAGLVPISYNNANTLYMPLKHNIVWKEYFLNYLYLVCGVCVGRVWCVHMCVCTCVCMYMPQWKWRGQRTTWGNWFSSSTKWVPVTKLRLSGFLVSALTYWVIWSIQNILNCIKKLFSSG